MTGHPDDGLPLHTQIANLEFRLAALRKKRETFLRHGRLMKRVAWIVVTLAPILVAYMAATSKSDPLPTVFLVSILVAAAAALLWIYRNSTWIGDPGRNEAIAYNRYTSYWLFIEQAIQQHEKRLPELKARS
jgi:hypothetical protein